MGAEPASALLASHLEMAHRLSYRLAAAGRGGTAREAASIVARGARSTFANTPTIVYAAPVLWTGKRTASEASRCIGAFPYKIRCSCGT